MGLCFWRQHSPWVWVTLSPKFSGMMLRTPQELDLLVESVLHGEGKATAAW